MTNRLVNKKTEKAPYEVVTVSIPAALLPMVERMCDRYKELVSVPDEDLVKKAMLNLLTDLGSV